MLAEFRTLGPLEVVDVEGRRVDLGAPRQRAVLAVLLIHLNEVVSIDRLIDELWGDTPPGAATTSLQAYVSNLRRVLEPERAPRTSATVLVTEAPGYVLRVAPEQVDAIRFERLAADGHRDLAAGEGTSALSTLDEALGLWRGDALADFSYEAFAVAEISRLHELRAAAEEDRVEALLMVGDQTGALAAVRSLIVRHPLRERLRWLQMRALYGAGRQAEALRAYEDARRALIDELGVEPGSDLQRLHRQVLDHDLADLTDEVAPAPVAPHEPARRTRSPSVARSGLLGRDGPLTTLHRALTDAVGGRTRMVLIEGEPGIGKTRLAAELDATAQERGATVSWGRCHDDEGAPPLWLWVQVLRGFVGGGQRVPEHLQPILAPLLPELGARSPDDLGSDAARFRLFDAVREAVERWSRQRPSLVVLDDLHWADVSSLRLLRFLAVELRDAPVVIVMTFRHAGDAAHPAFGDMLADLARRPDVERLSLTGLSEKDVTELLRQTTNVPDDALAAVASRVHHRTNGNPFFITELLRLMESERRLGPAGAADEIPAAVSDVIRRRLSRLPDDVQTVLDVASVIGSRFRLEVLAQACGLDIDRTLEALEAALATRVVVEEAPALYRFAHALVNETLYADLAPTRRARLHARIGAAIEATMRADLQPPYNELAYHFANATTGEGDQAFVYSRLAAEQATGRLAFDEAVAHWRAALAALNRSNDPDHAVRVRVLLELAAAERRAGHLAASASANDDALARAHLSGQAELLAETALAFGEVGLWQVRRYGTVDEHVVAAISDALEQISEDDSVLRARLQTGLAVALYYREGERERGRALARDAAAMARRLGDQDLLAASLVELLVILDAHPDQTEQLAVASELRGLRHSTTSSETESAIVLRLARIALANGDASTLEHDLERFARAAREARRPDEQLWVGWALTTTAFLHDRLDDAERLAGEAFSLHQQLGIWGAYETYASHMVWIWREQGRLLEVAPLLEPLLASSVHPSAAKLRATIALERGAPHEIPRLLTGDPVPRSRDFTWLTDMCVTAELAAAGNLRCRSELYDLLLPFADRIVTMDATFLCMGAAAYYLGLLAASLDRPDDAALHFASALRINEAVGARPWSRRCRAQLDRLALR